MTAVGLALLACGMVVEQAERGAAKDVGVEPLRSVLVLESLVPVGGGEVEDTTAIRFRQGPGVALAAVVRASF
jgi:hypothetical protein